MELAYKKLMEEYDLKVSDLPEDTRYGISIVEGIVKAIAMVEKKGQKVSELTFSKLKKNDQWAVRDILDFQNGTDKNEDEIPFEKEEVLEGIKTDAVAEAIEAVDVDKSKGNKINSELKTLIDTGKETLSAGELKKLAPLTYEVVFESYKSGEDNGVQTNLFLVKEIESEVFMGPMGTGKVLWSSSGTGTMRPLAELDKASHFHAVCRLKP